MANALANPLLDDDSGLGNGLTAPAGNPRHFYQAGEDGNWYNDSGDRVYYWVPPSETDSTIRSGGETQGIGEDLGGYYTEAEIAQAYNADEGMGYLTENVSWDNYWGFISERQGEIQAGTLVDPIQGEFAKISREQALENTDADAEISNTGRDEEIYYGQLGSNTLVSQTEQMGAWVSQNSSLMDKYGIETAFTNNDGDYFVFNGSSYTRAFKVDDGSGLYSQYLGVIGEALKSWMMTGGLAALAGGAMGAISKGIGAISNAVGYTKNWQGFVSGLNNLPAGIQELLVDLPKIPQAIAGGTVTWGGPASASAAATAEAAATVLAGSNVIVNLANTDPNKPYQGDGQGADPDGNVVWNTRNLPSIYSIINGDIVHTASGTVMSAGNYSASRTQYVSFPPYVEGDNAGGGAPDSSSTASNTSSATSSSSSNSSSSTNASNSSNTSTSSSSPSSQGGSTSGGTYEGVTLVREGHNDWVWDDRPEIWEQDTGNWVLISNTGVWGSSGKSVVFRKDEGYYVELDWDNGKYDKQYPEDLDNASNPFNPSSSSTGASTSTTTSTTTTPATSTSTSTTTAPSTPAPPKPGDACTLSDGSAGTIDGGGACQPSTGRFVNGSWMAGIDTAYQTGVRPSNSCESGWEYGNGTCIPTNSPHVPTSNPSNATATGSTPSTSTTSTTSSTPSTNTTSTSTTPSTSTSTTASTNSSNTTGTNQGPGNGSNEGPGDEGGNPGDGESGMLGGPIPGLRSGSKDDFGALFPGYQFRKFRKGRGNNKMAASIANTSNFQARKDIVDGLWKEVMKR